MPAAQTSAIALILSTFRRMFDYTGRSTRAEFWTFCLLFWLMGLFTSRVRFLLFLMLPVALAYIPLSVRRLRDAGLSPWPALLPWCALPAGFLSLPSWLDSEPLAQLSIVFFLLSSLYVMIMAARPAK